MPSDTERLDWLQQRQETVYRCTHQERRPTTSMHRPYETVQVFDGWAVLHDQEPTPTIREAIDAAMGTAGVAVAPTVDIAQAAKLANHLGNLLARIHRDGGHYVEQHGLGKALEDADAKVVEWLSRDDAHGVTVLNHQSK